ncbi:MAG: PH domain-containing protein [Acidimicrobiales bacterium]|nr:PH domain-containing protein [Acidimicrobiales bacterium]
MDAPALDGTPRSLDPRIRTVWRIGELAGAVIVGGAAIVAAVLTHAPGWLLGAAGGLAAVLVLRAIVWPGLAWRCWRWSAWPDAIELRHGVLWRSASLVPYHRIQQIDIHRGPIERMVGLSTLILRTAAAATDGRIPGVAADDAEALRHDLLARAGIDDAV